MYSFTNDYSEGAHPAILKALMEQNLEQNNGYGEDKHSLRAAVLIKSAINRPEADIHFLTGGTQTNLTFIASVLRPHQAVISASSGHINTHETGAIEATAHKVLTRLSPDGKLTPEMVSSILREHTDEHMVQPKMIYISNSTEIGTIYTKKELEALRRTCNRHQLYLYLDGARLGPALCSAQNDLELADIAALTDAFYIGGTKNGAFCGEALVITTESLQEDFRFLMKQRGALAAKGFMLGTQFEQLFQNDLFYLLATHANGMAEILREGIQAQGYSFLVESPTNQIFPIFPAKVVEQLQKEFSFHIWEEVTPGNYAIRLVTSWATKETAIKDFLKSLGEVSQRVLA